MKSKILLGILVSLTIILTVFVGVNAVEIEKNLQETKEDLIYSNKYLVKENSIYRIAPKTSINEFNKNIEVSQGKEIKIYKDKKEVTSGYIGTGMTVKESDGREYTTSVIGDITGDGLVNQLELTRLIRHIVKIKGWELEGVEKAAADITGDGEVNLIDVSRLINYIVYGNLEYEDIKNEMPKLTGDNTTLNYTPTNWTKGPVKVSINTTVKGYTLQYSRDNITWEDYKNQIEIKENGKIYVRLRDNKGMVGNVVSGSISNIDKTLPTVELSPNGQSLVMPEQGNAKISVILTAKDAGGSGLNLLQYAWSQSNTQEPTQWSNFTNGSKIEKADITKPGTWYLWTKVTDKAGNRAENIKISKAFIINENMNTIAFTANKTGWTNGDVTVAVKYGANLIRDKKLTCTGNIGADYTINGVESVVVKTNEKIVTAEAKDAQGKVTSKLLKINNIDKIRPIINTQPSVINKTTSSIDLSIGVADNESGISKIEWYYKLDTESTYKTKTDEYTKMNGANVGVRGAVTKTTTIKELKTGIYSIYAVVYDVAGNSKTSSTIRVGTTAMPAGNKNITFNYSTTNWTNQNVNVTITKANAVSGYTIQYSTNNTTWKNYTSAVPMTANGTIYARLVDNAGNVGTAVTGSVSKIDKTAPTISKALTAPKIKGTSVDLSISVSDTVSGISKIEWYYKLKSEKTFQYKTDEYTKINGANAGTKTSVTKTTTISDLKLGESYDIYAVIYDVAGNIAINPVNSYLSVTTKTSDEPVHKTCTGTVRRRTGDNASGTTYVECLDCGGIVQVKAIYYDCDTCDFGFAKVTSIVRKCEDCLANNKEWIGHNDCWGENKEDIGMDKKYNHTIR